MQQTKAETIPCWSTRVDHKRARDYSGETTMQDPNVRVAKVHQIRNHSYYKESTNSLESWGQGLDSSL